MKALIIGAGPSGISLAWFLKNNSWEVEVIEMRNKIGGLARSHKINLEGHDILIDSGPHIFHTSDEEIVNIWKSNFGELLINRDLYAANCKGIFFNDFHDYPISKEGLEKKGLKSDLIKLKETNPFIYNNYREYMKSKVGKDIEKEYFRNYPEKLWGISTKNMRADWAPKRIEIRDKILPFFYGQWCASAKFGSGLIYDKISEELLKKGGKINLNTEVKEISFFNNKIKKIITNKKDFFIDADTTVISTIPTIQLGRILKLNVTANYRGVIIFSILHSFNSFPEKYSWIYFENPKIVFTRVTNFSDLSPNATKGFHIYMYEVPFDSKEIPDINNLKEKIKDSISKIPWLANSYNRIINIQIEKYVYPIRELNYQKVIAKINSRSDSLDNLLRNGTAAEFEYGDVQICFRKSLDLSNDLKKLSHNNINKIYHQKNKTFSDNLKRPYKNNDIKFIAEIGLNHNGSIDIAKKLILVAKDSNADYVKFQLYNSDTRANKYTRDAFYQEESDGEGENLYQIFKRCELSFEEMKDLYIYSKKVGVNLFFSAFDRKTVKQAFSISPELIKISSMDLTNFEVCDEASKLFKNIIMSTGMSTIEDIHKSAKFITDRISKDNLTLLHCVSSYPMDISSIALGTIKELKKYSNNVGYSDHSIDPSTSLLAVAFGAKLIEKHITLDKKLPGPDHLHSLDPNELNNLVDILHNFSLIEKVRNGIIGSEKKEYRRQKKGYYYKINKKKGSILSIDDLELRPPCIGDDTFEISKKIGEKLKFDKQKFEPVRLLDF